MLLDETHFLKEFASLLPVALHARLVELLLVFETRGHLSHVHYLGALSC